MRSGRFVVGATAFAICVGWAGGGALPAQAVSTGAVPYVLGASTGLTAHSRMIAANGHLYVSQGPGASDTVVLDLAGNRIADVAGEPGASGMLASPDASHVYVALSNTNAIAVIDTSTQTETGRFTVDSCPTHLAWSAGRLFYSFGCNPGQNSSGVASIDPANPGPPVAALSNLYAPPLLAGTSSTLVVGAVGLDPSNIDTYAAASDGSLTHDANNRTNENLQDMTVTPDGAHLLTASGAPYQITQFDLPSLAQTLVLPGVAYPHAVAVSPDGSRIAAGFDSYDDHVRLYDTNGTVLWKRYVTTGQVPSGAWANPMDQVIPGALTFSPDGTQVYALITDASATGAVSLFHSVLDPTPTSLAVSIPSVAYGKAHVASVTLNGAPGGAVRLTRSSNGVTTTGTVTTGSSGTANQSFSSPYSGTVVATYLGDPAHYPATLTRAYTSASKTAIVLSGYYRTVSGVRYYHSYKNVHARITVSPKATGRPVNIVLWRRSGTKWVRQSALVGHTNSSGDVYIYLRSAPSRVRIRIAAAFAGDSLDRKSSTTSQSLIIQ